MNIQEFFEKLKFELHLLGLEIDDEFEKIEGRTVDLKVSGGLGTETQHISFGFNTDRKHLYGPKSPEEIAESINSYLARRNYSEGSPPSWAQAKPKPATTPPPRPRTRVAPLPPVPPAPPKRRVFVMGPSSEYTGMKRDYELTFQDFDSNVDVIIKTGDVKKARELRLSDLSQDSILAIQQLLKSLEHLNKVMENYQGV